MSGCEVLGDDAIPGMGNPPKEDRGGNAAGEECKATEAVAQVLRTADADHAKDEGDRREGVLQPMDVLPKHGAGPFGPAEVNREQAVLDADVLDESKEGQQGRGREQAGADADCKIGGLRQLRQQPARIAE